jgi:hypothetical protein
LAAIVILGFFLPIVSGIPVQLGNDQRQAIGEDKTVALTPNQTYCHGQKLYVESGYESSSSDKQYRIINQNTSEAVMSFSLNSTGAARIDTDGLPDRGGDFSIKTATGTYPSITDNGVITGHSEEKSTAFRLRPCQFQVSFTDESITIDDVLGVKTRLTVDGNHTTSVLIQHTAPENVTLSPATLAAMFNGTATTDGTRVQVPADGTIPVRTARAFACASGPGVYEFTVQSVDTSAISTASLTAESDLLLDAEFSRDHTTVRRGSVAMIPLQFDDDPVCWDGDALTLEIEGESTPFHATTQFQDVNDDGEVALTIDTGRAGNAAPDQYLSAQEPDTTSNETQRSPRRRPPLSTGTYTIRLRSEYGVVTTGWLTIQSNASETTTWTDGQRTETGQPGTQSTKSTTQSQPTTTPESGAGFGILVVVLAISVVTALGGRRS